MNHTFEMFDICFVYIVIIINLSVKHNCEQAAYHCWHTSCPALTDDSVQYNSWWQTCIVVACWIVGLSQ